jgi:hypothetical protein
VKLMLAHGADKNRLEGRGMSTLDLAIQQGNEEAIWLLQSAPNSAKAYGLPLISPAYTVLR